MTWAGDTENEPNKYCFLGVLMIENLKDSLIATLFASIGGLLYFLSTQEEGKPFRWRACFIQVAVSAFSGLIAYICVINFAGVSPDVGGAFSGVAGWMGTRLLKIFELAFRKRMGVE